MADQDVSDLIMKFVISGNTMVAGETRSDLDLTQSDMTVGFQQGYMIEIDSFTFRTGIGGEDEEAKKERKAHESKRKEVDRQHADSLREWDQLKRDNPTLAKPRKPAYPEPTSVGSYSRFRQGEAAKYPVDMQPVEFKRGIDMASSTLLQNCINRVNYSSATLIKRKPTGGPASGEVFLRFDFDTVLMTRVDWDDDVPIKESCKFICRAVTIHYKPQLPDGTLGDPIQGFYTMAPNKTAFVI